MKRLIKELFFLFYDILFIVLFLVHLPFYFLRKKITFFSLLSKIGFFLPKFNKSIWVHAVSVGEVNLIEPLINRIIETLNYPILISTTTLTGNKLAKEKYKGKAKIIYFPVDISLILQRFLKKIKPIIFISAETELWPNLIRQLQKKKIPFLIINGRISDQAFARYKLIKPIVKTILSDCSQIGVQNEKYRKRFIELGAKPSQVLITGNLKFNNIKLNQKKIEDFKQKYNPIMKLNSQRLLVAASTHSPEEDMILDIYKDIYLAKNLSLLIAPRHPQRASDIQRIALAKGFKPILISKISQFKNEENNIFILDTIGQLLYFYSICDLCFVGGSFSGSGGHNILEPIYLLKPVIFGPSMENFSDISEIVINNSAGIQVNSPKQLKEKIITLLDDKNKCLDYAKAAINVFKNSDSLNKNFRLILNQIKSTDEY